MKMKKKKVANEMPLLAWAEKNRQQQESIVPLKFITHKEAIAMLYEHRRSQHTIFSVLFEKRTDGTPRLMPCMFNVKKYLAGGEAAYNPREYNLMFVWDTEKANYRCINLETLMWMRMAKRIEGKVFERCRYIVTCNKPLQEKHFPQGLEDFHGAYSYKHEAEIAAPPTE